MADDEKIVSAPFEVGRVSVDLGKTPAEMRKHAQQLEDFGQLQTSGPYLTTAWLVRQIADLTERVHELERNTR